MTCRLALAVPGTTPDYWATVDDRLTATMLAVLDERAAGTPTGKRRR